MDRYMGRGYVEREVWRVRYGIMVCVVTLRGKCIKFQCQSIANKLFFTGNSLISLFSMHSLIHFSIINTDLGG